jgi:hypothetical protein
MKSANKKITMEDLAGMVQRGFTETAKKTDLETLKETNTREHQIMTENNTREHESIKLRLNNVAYRFELVELQKRVDVLEKKVGVRHK